MQFDLLTNIDALYRFIDRCRLPTELGGDQICRHAAWLCFRQVSQHHWTYILSCVQVATRVGPSDAARGSTSATSSGVVERGNDSRQLRAV
jgi:hypothetical protein